MYRWFCLFAGLSVLAACGDKATTMDEFITHPVTLPDGTVIRSEVATKPIDLAKGLMFRKELASDRGMLFLQEKPGAYRYWMYQTHMPLDIIWMDAQHRVVEIAPNCPPCLSKSAKECPVYGGNVMSQSMFEVNAGVAQKHGVVPGARLSF